MKHDDELNAWCDGCGTAQVHAAVEMMKLDAKNGLRSIDLCHHHLKKHINALMDLGWKARSFYGDPSNPVGAA